MNTTGNETLERIQREIKENLEKEEEWKRELDKMSNGCNDLENNNSQKDNRNQSKMNGEIRKTVDYTKVTQSNNKFIQNVKTRGVMQRFFKLKGKSVLPKPSIIMNGNIPQVPKPITDFDYQPPKITSETGNLTRNGFVPAEVKIRNEVQDFQKREIELRKERRKSQPELMALLKIEDELNHKDENFPEYSCSSSTSSISEMKSAKSLADLCNTPEEELDAPGTFNLIKQFESLRSN